MCLFITVTPPADANRTAVKRAMKGASVLSAYSPDGPESRAYHLGTSDLCACDLRESGPDGAEAVITVRPGVGAALGAVAAAVLEVVDGPIEVRVYWADTPTSERQDLNLQQFSELARGNVFRGNVVYRVGKRLGAVDPRVG